MNILDYFSKENTGIRAMRSRRLNVLADLSRILQSDKPNLQEALRRVADRNAGKPIESAYRNIISGIKSGKENGLSSALQPYFPEREYLLVKAFDIGATGDRERGEGFATAAKILKPLAELKKGFYKLLATAVFSSLVIGVMWLGMAPFFAGLLSGLVARDKWYLLSKVVVFSAEFLRNWWFVFLPLIVILIGWLIWALPNWYGNMRRWFDQKVPGFVIYREYSSIMTLVAMASFLKANQGFDWTFQQLRRLCTRWEGDYIDAIQQRSKQYGASKMLDVGYIPDEIIDRIALREGTDSLEQNLSNVALQNVEELTGLMSARLAAARTVLGDVSQVLGGLVVIAIVLLILASLQYLTKAASA